MLRFGIFAILVSAALGAPRAEQASCNHNQVITRPISIISHDGYGNIDYPANSHCEWVIEAPKDKIVKIEVVNFDVESDSRCRYDSVKFYDGKDGSGVLLANRCGTDQTPVLSRSRYMHIVFESDNSVNEAGFELQIRFTDISEIPSGCGNSHHLKATNIPQFFTSTNYETGGNYLPNSDCQWLVEAPEGSTIRFEFEEPFHIEYQRNCEYDHLSFFDDKNDQGELLGRVCGTTPPDPISTSWSKSFVHFVTDSTNHYRGFKVKYVAVKGGPQPTTTTNSPPGPTTTLHPGSQSGCGGDYFLDDASGHIYSPGFTEGNNYPPNTRCQWRIHGGPSEDRRVGLRFVDFELEESQQCAYDYLHVFDGPDSDSLVINKYCGRDRPDPIVSTGPDLYLEFHTDSSQQFKGFKLYYAHFDKNSVPPEFIPPPTTTAAPTTRPPVDSGCGNPRFMYGPSGTFTTMNFGNGNYDRNALCTWVITANSNDEVVKLSFESFHLEQNSGCSYDYIEVRDGDSANSPLLKRLCGSTIPEEFSSTGNAMHIKFVSDSSNEFPGFKAHYITRVPPPTCSPTQFTCRESGSCIPLDQRCDGKEDCPDGSDEKGCLGGSCGVPAIEPHEGNGRVVGGQEAKKGSWPWQAQLQYNGRHFCGASVVTDDWVVTAAHCTEGRTNPSSWKVTVGRHHKTLSEDTHQVLSVSKIIMHESYGSGGNLNNDVALMKLKRSMTFSDEVSAICLPSRDVTHAEMCYTTGWGSTKGTGNDNVLKQAHVPIVSRDVCNRSNYYGGRITDKMICAGYEQGGHDACQGDSGGPFVCKRGSKWELSGVVSWGIGCAGPLKPGVYTNTIRFNEWIAQKIESN